MVSTGRRVTVRTQNAPNPAARGLRRPRLPLALLLLRRSRGARPQSLAEQQGHRRDQGQGDDHRDRDGGRGGQSHHREHGDLRHREPGEGDHDGGPGEDDGAAGRGQGARHRLLRREPFAEVASMARQDEQRVVDADGQAQHLREGRGVARHGGERRHQDHRAQRHADPDQGRDDRHAGRQQGAEGDREDHERDEQAEELGHVARVGRRLVGVAAHRGRDRRGPRRRGRLLHRVERGLRRHLVGEPELRDGRGVVLGQDRVVGGERVAHADAVHRVGRLDDLRDVRGVRLVGDLPRGRRQQHLAVGPGQPEPGAEHVLALLRLGTGDGDRVVVLVAEHGGAAGREHEQQEPDSEHHPSAPGDRPTEAEQHHGHVRPPQDRGRMLWQSCCQNIRSAGRWSSPTARPV